jgi:hypothetical protein
MRAQHTVSLRRLLRGLAAVRSSTKFYRLGLTMQLVANCDANPTFKPIASGGDGEAVQFWYVGIDPTLKVGAVS